MSNGTGLSTKGLVSGGGGTTPAPEPDVLLPPPEELILDVDIPHKEIIIVIPTATNVVLMAAENITANLLAKQPSALALPSLYKRAYLVAHETDEIALVKAT